MDASFTYYFLLATEKRTLGRAIRVALLVGIILNLINNPEIFFSLSFHEFHPGRAALVFVVPFAVSIYSSILTNSSLKPGKISEVDAILKCNNCRQTDFSVSIGQQIDACPQCKKDTRWKLSKIFSTTSSGNDVLKSLALFARHNPQPLFRLDHHGMIIGDNPAAETMLAHDNNAGEKLELFIPAVKGIDWEKLINREEATEVLISLNKHYYNFLLKGIPALQTVHVYGNDITGIVLAEEKIRLQAKDIGSSIQYAWRIQKSMLPGEAFMSSMFPSSFVFYRPRNIVSGDFYWVNQIEDLWIIAVADCTGHGVPGAFMSMLGISLLNDIILRERIVEPDNILNELRKRLIFSLSLNQDDSGMTDGMDIALVTVHSIENVLAFAGAYNPLLICREGSLIVHEADRMPVGKFVGETPPFTVKRDRVLKGDRIFLYSDGYQDQFGGEKNKKFSQRRFRELLLQTNQLSFDEVNHTIEKTFDSWKSNNTQVDDVLILGIEFT